MKIRYETTTISCPVCGELLQYTNTLERMLLLMVTFPISIPGLISWFLLNSFVFGDIIPAVKPPSFFKCKCCGKELKIPGYRLKSELSESELLTYSFRWWFRLCYALGVIVLWLIFVLICILTSNKIKTGELQEILSILFGSLAIIAVIATIFRIKKSKL